MMNGSHLLVGLWLCSVTLDILPNRFSLSVTAEKRFQGTAEELASTVSYGPAFPFSGLKEITREANSNLDCSAHCVSYQSYTRVCILIGRLSSLCSLSVSSCALIHLRLTALQRRRWSYLVHARCRWRATGSLLGFCSSPQERKRAWSGCERCPESRCPKPRS